MSESIWVNNGYIYDKTLSPIENDWLSCIPATLRRPAYLCLQEMRETVKFNNSIERNKATMLYMDAFVTAIALATDERKANDEAKKNNQDHQKDQHESCGQKDLEGSGSGAACGTRADGSNDNDHGN